MDPFSKKSLNYTSYFKSVQAFSGKPVTQTSTALVLTLVTIAFFGFAAIRPTLATISELQAEIKEKELVLEKIKTKLQALNTIQREIQANQEYYLSFDTGIPDTQMLNEVLIMIEILAQENNAPINSIRVSTLDIYGETDSEFSRSRNVEPEVFDSYIVDVAITSEYLTLIDFIADVDNSMRYAKIESIRFAQPVDEELEGLLTLSLRVKYFWDGEALEEEELDES